MRTMQGQSGWARMAMFCSLTIAATALLLPDLAEAQRRGGGGARSANMARSSVSGANRAAMSGYRGGQAAAATRPSGSVGNRANTGDVSFGNRANTGNINSGNRVNTGNINTGDVNIDRDVHVDIDQGGWGWEDNHYHPVAAAAVVTAAAVTTAAVLGSRYYAVPVGCPIVHTYATPYYYCGGVYYQQQMQGDTVVYVVVSP